MNISELWENLGDSHGSLKSISAIVGILIFLGQGAVYGTLYYIPMDYWLTYHAMTVNVKQAAGQGFNVKSYASFKRPVDINYTDVLQCWDEETQQYLNFSAQPFSIEAHYPPDDKVAVDGTGYGEGESIYLSPWRYSAETPKSKATCRIRGVQEITLFLGITKESVVFTNEFEFVPDTKDTWKKGS